jgi:hypothetical protein
MSALALAEQAYMIPRGYLLLLLSCTSQIRETIVRAQPATFPADRPPKPLHGQCYGHALLGSVAEQDLLPHHVIGVVYELL